MRLTEVRWAGDPARSVSFHPRLTVLCDLPHDPATGSIGVVLASLPDHVDGVFELEPGELAMAPADASEGVVRLDAAALADAWRELARRRAGRARAELERGHDVLREEDAVLAGRERARRRAGRDLAERREASAADLAARRAEVVDAAAKISSVESALRCLDEVEHVEVGTTQRPGDALAERWIDLVTAIAFLGTDMPTVRTFAEAEQALATARPDQRREDSLGQISVADAEALHRAHQEVERAQRRAERLLAGRGARRALAGARAAERELLDRLGFTDYGEYLASVAFDAETPDVDEAESSAVRAAEDRLAQATALYRADLERWEQLEEELREVRSEVRELVGAEPADDPLRVLQGKAARNQRLEAALVALADALAQVGVVVPEGRDQAPAAREWLEREHERRAELEAQVSELSTRAARERSEIDEQISAVESELDALAAERGELATRIGELRAAIAGSEREREAPEEPELAHLPLEDVEETFSLALPRVGDPEWTWPLVVDHALDELPEPARTRACERLATRSRAQQVVIVTDDDEIQEWASTRHVGTVAGWPPAPSEADVPEADVPEADPGDPFPGPAAETAPEPVQEADAPPSEDSIDLVLDERPEAPPPPDPTTVALRCARHSHLRASTRCGRCRQPFCERCLVTVGRGPEARVLCVDCALSVAGVRVRRRRRRR